MNSISYQYPNFFAVPLINILQVLPLFQFNYDSMYLYRLLAKTILINQIKKIYWFFFYFKNCLIIIVIIIQKLLYLWVHNLISNFFPNMIINFIINILMIHSFSSIIHYFIDNVFCYHFWIFCVLDKIFFVIGIIIFTKI